jgi:hypothetical protein
MFINNTNNNNNFKFNSLFLGFNTTAIEANCRTSAIEKVKEVIQTRRASNNNNNNNNNNNICSINSIRKVILWFCD